MDERWLPIPGYDYEVSDLGRIRRAAPGMHTYAGRILNPRRLLKGYPGVSFYNGTKNKATFTIHSLVAAAFIGERPEGYQVNHKDGNKLNNVATNLEYVTPLRNIQHAYTDLGRDTRGEKNPAAKLTPADVEQIRLLYRPWKFSTQRLATMFGVTKRSILNVLHGKTWSAEC